MTDTGGAVTSVVTRNYDGVDPVELDRLSESLETCGGTGASPTP
jgi:hypothetical protein